MAVAEHGRKRFRGTLIALEGDSLRLRRDDAKPDEAAEVLLAIDRIGEARMVLTDALVAESLKRGKLAERELRQNLGLEAPSPNYHVPKANPKQGRTKQQRLAAQSIQRRHHEGD